MSSYRIDGGNGPRRKTFKDKILEIGLVMSLGFSAGLHFLSMGMG